MKPFDARKRGAAVLFAVLMALTVAFIWTNSCLPQEVSGQQSGLVMRILRPLLNPNGKISEEAFHHFVRKAAHFSEFALLGAWIGAFALSVRREMKRSCWLLPVFAVLLVAAMDETIQRFTGRGSAASDVILDFSGGLAGLAVSVLLILFLRKRSEKK